MTEPRGQLHNLYSKFAGKYDQLYGPLLAHGLKMAIKEMHIESHMQVLEIAIGTGLSLPLYPRGIHIVGIDISKEMLEEAQEKINRLRLKNARLVNMSAEKLNFPDCSFDRVFAPSALSVISNPEIAFREMIRICKPGGQICVVSHFAGEKIHTKILDLVFNRLTQMLLGFRTTTSRDFVEKNTELKLLVKKNTLPLNFSTLYIFAKK